MNCQKSSFLIIVSSLIVAIGAFCEKAIALSPCNDNQLQASYNSSSSSYHEYTVENKVCSIDLPGCTQDFVFNIMLSQVRFIAPTDQVTPVQNCKITILDIPGPFGEDPIRTTVNQNQYSITNYTREDHALHPGIVNRTVIEKDGHIVISTFGEGEGILPTINENQAPDLWGDVDRGLIREVRLRLPTCTNKISGAYQFANESISVNAGDKIRIRASGSIRLGLFAGSASPAGISYGTSYNHFSNALHGHLLGRIFQPGMQDLEGWFSVGNGIDMVAEVSGMLEFLVNDSDPQNNSGAFCVEIENLGSG
ncbi:hypothetical protein [Spirulina sp. 06S082]|uniref:hypothetical protein n=1 Tax=Spirulina sp. 06S082 TaxID=3110248 RepID=UPI002B1EEAED|nr:hypothetical protein [Spirulina sp. 06S082]MEA5470156.1 hypothetical protein [Spirulina sp. 06S082]